MTFNMTELCLGQQCMAEVQKIPKDPFCPSKMKAQEGVGLADITQE